MSNGIKAWSWSRFADYLQCPRKAKFKHVQRMKEPGSAAMNRGAALHDILSGYITGKLVVLPIVFTYEFEGETIEEEFPLMKSARPLLTKLRAAYKKKNHSGMTVEDDWAFTKNWEPTRWDDWTHCWVRMKLDLAYTEDRGKTLIIDDWKSGRSRDEEKRAYEQQLQLYAIAGLIKYPKVKQVKPRLFFIDSDTPFDGAVVLREDLERLKEAWKKTTAPMFLDTLFAPRPNQKCRWCWFGTSKKASGGPGLCEF